ncbi:MAG: DEAD/DEAH box helicase [Clostridia bacterium]|nr:DEAD/DEAH box helicase [Clostridia bacterium]
MGKKFTLRCGDGAFDKDVQRSKIAGEVRPFDAKMATLTKCAEELDRYDDFAELKIKPDVYKNQGGKYGIIPLADKGGQTILKGQQSAVTIFLKELRGFGLLADVVGSGKTFEACAILSELAVRGKMQSLLLVVPSQVYDSWINVLENLFGLGEGVLLQVKDPEFGECDEVLDGYVRRPKRPVIVKTEDFVKWNENQIKDALFDVVVVDEAHHLCTEEGEYAKAMKLLSLLMVTKKRANSTYCVLLSATPHSGNLDKMFRLWYFIRCKGGNPDDFDVKDDKDRTLDYKKEKEYYRLNVCRGANTVSEFITAVKQFEIDNNYTAPFKAFLRGKKELDKWDSYSQGEKQVLREEFLNKDGNEHIRQEVLRRVAGAYHNGVLRTIMIRQPNELSKSRFVYNNYFYPIGPSKRILETQGVDGRPIKVDLKELNTSKAIEADGEHYSLKGYAEEYCKNRDSQEVYAELIISKILGKLGSFGDANIFDKRDSQKYYWEQFERKIVSESNDRFLLMPSMGDSFEYKLRQAKKILEEHEGERALMFFDYDLPKTSKGYRQWNKVIDALNADEKFKDRIIVGTAENKDKNVKKFLQKSDAILIVTDSAFTEGVNLQDSRLIINFQVTPDPLAMDQRIGRVFRLGQSSDVKIYSFADMNKLEGFALAYFNSIGLLNSNSGDATIIAGSNNERMVALRCPACGKVALYSKGDYELAKKKGELYCINDPKICCLDDPNGTLMEEINVYEFKCSGCSTTLSRSVGEGGYKCISKNNDDRGTMCNSGMAGDREYYCSKICVMRHCSRFKGEFKDKCKVLQAYEQNPNVATSDLQIICAKCSNKAECPQRCRFGVGRTSIEACASCRNAECHPKPYTIAFDDKWSAKCPICAQRGEKGTLYPVVARTFAAYMKASWDFKHDGGESFCNNLMKEASKVADIKAILSMDSMSERR